MNHIFKIIWNTVNQCWIAVSELSKSVGKSSQTDKRKALNVIIGAAVLAGVSTTAMAETNVVLNNDGNIVGGTDVSAVAGVGTTGDSVVLGKKAKSEATESIVIGNNVTNKARWSITLGNNATSQSGYGVTLGDRASSGTGSNSVAIGLMAKTSNEKAGGGNSQTAVGVASYADGEGASAFGATANATGALATAVGRNSKALAKSASALGDSASASAWGATALGVGASARADNSIAVGSAAVTEGRESTALGRRSYAGAQSATALGTLANASAIVSTAVGNDAKASAIQASALGNGSNASGSGALALGAKSNASAADALATGSNSVASSTNAVAVGKDSNSSAVNAIALGQASNASAVSAVVIGTQAKATHENSVTLGSYSSSAANDFNQTAKALSYFGDKSSVTVKYNGTSSTQKGAVSVGDGKLVRQIQNVGAGRITAESTDAVNGSQLYQAYYNAGFNIQNNDTDTSRINTNGKVNFVNGENTKVVVEDGDNAAKITVNAKDTSASVEAGSDAITVTVGGETTKKDGLSVTTVTNYKVDLSQKTKDEIKNAGGRGFNVTASASEGTVVNEVTEETVQSTATKMDKLTLDAGKNIKLTHKKGKVLSVAVSDTPTFTNVTTTGDLNVGGTVHAHGGLDVHNNRIVNVADPKDPTDAVNKRYVDNKIDHVERRLRAGIAGATAISFLQRPNEAGKSLVSVGVGGYRNENAIAVGYGRNSDNNKISIKVGASINSRSDVNWGGSIGYQW